MASLRDIPGFVGDSGELNAFALGSAIADFTQTKPRLLRALLAALEDSNAHTLYDTIATQSPFGAISDLVPFTGIDTNPTALLAVLGLKHDTLWTNPEQQDIDDTLGIAVSAATRWTPSEIVEIFEQAWVALGEPSLAMCLRELASWD
jgi:hypothetical protein